MGEIILDSSGQTEIPIEQPIMDCCSIGIQSIFMDEKQMSIIKGEQRGRDTSMTA